MSKKTIGHVVCAVLYLSALVGCYFVIDAIYDRGSLAYTESINNELEEQREAIINDATFHDGIVISGISVGGMTVEEARIALSPIEEQLVANVGFSVYHPSCTVNITENQFDITYDTEQILEDAIMLAREGELEFLHQLIDDISANGRAYEISCEILPREGEIRSLILGMARLVYVPPTDATYEPNPDSVFVTEDTYEGVDDPTSLPDYVSPDRFIFHEAQNGSQMLAEDAIQEVIERTATRDFGIIQAKTEDVPPTVTVESLQANLVLRSHYESSYARSPYNASNRVYNIKKACKLVNGTMLTPENPDDPDDESHIFYTNEVLGDRTEENGWLLAPGFVDGGANSEDSAGGGVCHVSSTIYNAVVLGDFNIIFRINHSSHVGYVPWGQDATIDTGRIDFIWSNNTDHNCYIFMWVDTKEKLVRCEIWGEPFPSEFDSIDFYAVLVEEIPIGPTQYIETSWLYEPYWYQFNKAKIGYKYQSYKRYYLNGVPVSDPIEVALSTYKMHPLRYCVWPGFDPAVDVLDPNYEIPKPTPEPD